LQIQMTTATGRMMEHSNLVLTLDNYPKLIDKILEFKKMDGIEIDVGENIGYYGCKGPELFDGAPYLGCYAGVFVAGIESNGNVKGCLSMQPQFVEGNIRDSSFTEIWNNPDGFAYNRKFTRETAEGFCRECRYLPLCRGGCTTTSVSASGKRADNPYCIYKMERTQGIEADVNPYFAELMERFQETRQAAKE
jgi:radical SAM protein with 4Fe4S-binding SPASM domain